MLKTLELPPLHRGIALLIRHATRDFIPVGSQGIDIPLTEQGILLAERLGFQLKRRIRCIKSSPSGRCIETGRAIAKGAGIQCDIILEPLLGEPGVFVIDVEKASPWFIDTDPLPMINKQLKGEEIPGTRFIKEGVRLLLETMFMTHIKPGELDIYITHDSVLVCAIYYLAGINNINEEMWPWMLEGACLWKVKNKVCWAWRGQVDYIYL
jgi:broad specificity phosphatase PhoE